MAKEIIIRTERKVWKPTTSSTSLVVTLPKVEFLKEGDNVILKITGDKKIIIEKA